MAHLAVTDSCMSTACIYMAMYVRVWQLYDNACDDHHGGFHAQFILQPTTNAAMDLILILVTVVLAGIIIWVCFEMRSHLLAPASQTQVSDTCCLPAVCGA